MSDDNDEEGTKSNTMKFTRIIVISVVLTGMLLLGLVLVLFVWEKKSQKGSKLFKIKQFNYFPSLLQFSTMNFDL